jgi:hypothetical protein
MSLCQCGCGKETNIATHTNKQRGAVKGQPCRFIPGHTGQKKKEIVPRLPQLCKCGCGQEINTHRSPHYKKRPVAERFWSHVAIGLPDECWEWQAARYKYGHGKTAISNHSIQAHRLAYELTYGTIPDGLLICHKCNNPPCCNPQHLYAGTYTDNMQDSIKAGTAHYLPPMIGQQNPRAKLTNESVQLIRKLYAEGGIFISYLAKRFNVSSTTIAKIVHSETWIHLL